MNPEALEGADKSQGTRRQATWTLDLNDYTVILEAANMPLDFALNAFVKCGKVDTDQRFPLQLRMAADMEVGDRTSKRHDGAKMECAE